MHTDVSVDGEMDVFVDDAHNAHRARVVEKLPAVSRWRSKDDEGDTTNKLICCCCVQTAGFLCR